MRKDSGFSSKQITAVLLICIAMAVIYFTLLYFLGRSIANAILMWGLLGAAVVVLIVKMVRGKL